MEKCGPLSLPMRVCGHTFKHRRNQAVDTHANKHTHMGTFPQEKAPSVWAIKQMLLYYAGLQQQQLEFYIDLHAHANKKGVFTFANSMQGEQQMSSLLYSRLCCLNSPVFDFGSCNYTEKNMGQRDKVRPVLPFMPHPGCVRAAEVV
eukprot:365028-Chlamydomonas_euryale.AAC.25